MSTSEGINIFSGETGLGAALTNPTELAKSKGGIERSYPVVFGVRRYPDVETAYHLLADKGDTAATDRLMAELIAAKFQQHPDLADEVRQRGGSTWLAKCSHFTSARSESAQAWEGQGLQSRFIRNLVAGYELAQTASRTENGQQLLF